MKNTRKGFVMPILIAIIAVLVVGGGIYFYSSILHGHDGVCDPCTSPDVVSTSTDQYSSWKTYSNTVYHYSIKYPSNWSVDSQYSNQDFTPRGPAPHDYIGGDTSISNYSQSQINQYQKTNGDLAYPEDYIAISLMFWKTPNSSNLDSVPVDADSFKKENVVVNGVPGVKMTTLGQKGIGGATKPNSVGYIFKLNGEVVNIRYGFDGNNVSITKIADQIINSFAISSVSTLKPSPITTASSTSCGFSVASVSANAKVAFPLTVTGTIDRSNAKQIGCSWGTFEGQGGSAQLYFKSNANWYSLAIVPIKVSDWTAVKTAFNVTLNFNNSSFKLPSNTPMKIVFKGENPSGLAKNNTTFELPIILK